MSARAMRHVALVAAMVLLAPLADASPRRGVVVRAVPGAPVEAAPAADALAAALGESGPGEVVKDPVEVARARLASGAVERTRLADFARARELTREAWRAYLKADVAFAEAQLVNARRTLEAVLDLDGALEQLADVSLRLGAVRLKSGRAGEAQLAFALAAALDPEREALAQEFSPAVVAAYQAARGARGGGAKGVLELVVAADVAIEVDGVPVGRGARRVEVVAGEHVVVARAAGRRAAGQVVTVPAAGARVDLSLDEDALAVALGGGLVVGMGERPAGRIIDAVGVLADLDELWLVVVSWRGGQPALVGQRCALVPLACTPVREVRFASIARLGAGARQLVRDLTPRESPAGTLGPIVLEDTRATEPEPPRRGAGGGSDGSDRNRRAWWKNGWLWAGVGAACVAAGATVWLLSDTGPGDVMWTLPPLVK